MCMAVPFIAMMVNIKCWDSLRQIMPVTVSLILRVSARTRFSSPVRDII